MRIEPAIWALPITERVVTPCVWVVEVLTRAELPGAVSGLRGRMEAHPASADAELATLIEDAALAPRPGSAAAPLFVVGPGRPVRRGGPEDVAAQGDLPHGVAYIAVAVHALANGAVAIAAQFVFTPETAANGLLAPTRTATVPSSASASPVEEAASSGVRPVPAVARMLDLRERAALHDRCRRWLSERVPGLSRTLLPEGRLYVCEFLVLETEPFSHADLFDPANGYRQVLGIAEASGAWRDARYPALHISTRGVPEPFTFPLVGRRAELESQARVDLTDWGADPPNIAHGNPLRTWSRFWGIDTYVVLVALQGLTAATTARVAEVATTVASFAHPDAVRAAEELGDIQSAFMQVMHTYVPIAPAVLALTDAAGFASGRFAFTRVSLPGATPPPAAGPSLAEALSSSLRRVAAEIDASGRGLRDDFSSLQSVIGARANFALARRMDSMTTDIRGLTLAAVAVALFAGAATVVQAWVAVRSSPPAEAEAGAPATGNTAPLPAASPTNPPTTVTDSGLTSGDRGRGPQDSGGSPADTLRQGT